MAEDTWEAARLISVSGINGAEEQERRGASALLAVIESVREFGRTILQPLGAPAGTISTFIEVNLRLGERTVRPDGAIRVVRGARSWTALVEVKTGRNDLIATQVEDYLDAAREHGFDAVITISNELVAAPGDLPYAIDHRKLRKVALHHMSWSEIHTEAVIEQVNRSVSDPDQAWILAELIRYLEHTKSGAVDFDDMGGSWVSVRDAAAQRTLRANDTTAAEVVDTYGQLVAFAGMSLSRNLGVEVTPALTKSELADRGAWMQAGVTRLVEHGTLDGSLRVPNAVAPFVVTADLRSGHARCSITVDAPADGRGTTRVNWLVRQLANASEKTLIEATTARARRGGSPQTLAAVREDPRLLIEDPTKEIKSFKVTLNVVAGTKRGQGRGSFVGSVLELTERFYVEIVQNIRPWSASAPKVKTTGNDEDDFGSSEITGELPARATVRARSAEPRERVDVPSDDDAGEAAAGDATGTTEAAEVFESVPTPLDAASASASASAEANAGEPAS